MIPFLTARRKEVIDIMEMLFSQEEVWEMTKRELKRDAKQEGINEGRNEGRNEVMKLTALRMLATGKYILDEIVDISGLSLDEVKKLQIQQKT